MIAVPKFIYRTPQEYLEWEAQQETRHEYVDGEIFAMTGGSIPHNVISGNIFALFKAHLRGRNCRVFMADVKVKIALSSSFHYPDVVVTCDERDLKNRKFIQYPSLIIEVLSPSTEAYDRGEKFRRYRQLSSLQEYVLVSTQNIHVDRFYRTHDDRWTFESYSQPYPQASGELQGELSGTASTEPSSEEGIKPIVLDSIQWRGAMDLWYEDISLEAEENPDEESE